jgi:hypothetical protein
MVLIGHKFLMTDTRYSADKFGAIAERTANEHPRFHKMRLPPHLNGIGRIISADFTQYTA